jgi:RNA recognition motif-containing protein
VTVKVICHPVTGKSKGYGFVKYSSETEAAAALEKMRDEVNRASYTFRYMQRLLQFFPYANTTPA